MSEKKCKADIEKELSEYIRALSSCDLQITEKSTIEEMNIDSITLVKIFVFIEKKFGISLMNASFSKKDLETFGTLTDFLAAQLPRPENF